MLCLLKVLSRDAVHHNTSYRIKKYKKLVSLLLAIIVTPFVIAVLLENQ